MGIVIGHGRRIVVRLPNAPLPERERLWPLDARLALFVLEAEAPEGDPRDAAAAAGAANFGEDPAPQPTPSIPRQQRQQQRGDERVPCRVRGLLLYSPP